MRYNVDITDAAFALIREAAHYIAIDAAAPLNAGRWLEQVWDAIDGLEAMPSRCVLAAESAYKTYEVRRQLVGNYLILFTIDEAAHQVWVIGFRHGSRQPRPEELPDAPPGQTSG